MAKGKDFRGGLNSLLKRTEPAKKSTPKKEVTPVKKESKVEEPKTLPTPKTRTTQKRKVTTNTAVTPPKKIVEVKEEPKRKRGRPKVNHKVITKTSQIGTKEGETRATFIVKEEYLEKFKALAYWERKSIKAIINDALEQYLITKDEKIIKRALKSYNDK